MVDFPTFSGEEWSVVTFAGTGAFWLPCFMCDSPTKLKTNDMLTAFLPLSGFILMLTNQSEPLAAGLLSQPLGTS